MKTIHLIDDQFDACLPVAEPLSLGGGGRWWQPLLTAFLLVAHALTLARPAQAAEPLKSAAASHRKSPAWEVLPDTPAALLPDYHRYGAQGTWGYHPWEAPRPPEGGPDTPQKGADSLEEAAVPQKGASPSIGGTSLLAPQATLPYSFTLATGALTITLPVTASQLTVGCVSPDVSWDMGFDQGSILVHCADVRTLFVDGNALDNIIDTSPMMQSDYPVLQRVTIEGRDGNDDLTGTFSDDSLVGGSGGDYLTGNAGSDTLLASTGDDSLSGGTGDDYLDASPDVDGLVSGGLGNDTLLGVLGGDSFSDDGGSDWLIEPDLDIPSLTLSNASIGDFEIVRITAGDSPNLIDGSGYTAGTLYVEGLGGNDTLIGGAGGSTLLGGDDNDSLVGGAAEDTLNGGLGYDTLIGSGGNDWLYGGGDDDIITGGQGADYADGGSGVDRLVENLSSPLSATLTLSATFYLEPDLISPTIGITNPFTNIETAEITATLGAQILDAHAFSGTVTLDGGAGSDTLYGASGDDVLLASAYGAGDSNWLQGNGGADFIVGADGNDVLLGDDPAASAAGGADTISGGAGDDTLVGHAGSDLLTGEAGRDLMYGSNDGDTLLGGGDDDTLWGGLGDDSLVGEAGSDILNGEDGHDVLQGGTEDDTLYGSVGSDQLTGNAGNDLLYGEDDNDSLYGSDGDDALYGGRGDDFVQSTAGLNVFYGEAGNDTIVGGLHDDTLYGGDGSDSLLGGAANDLIYGENGGDWADGEVGNDLLYGDSNDSAFPGPDTLTGGNGTDEIYGGAGNDLLFNAESGVNIFHGGTDDDLYQFQATGNSTNTAQENLNEGANDRVEFTATAGDDHIILDAAAEQVSSGADSVHFDANLETLTVLAGDGDDLVEVIPSQFVAFHVDGGAHLAGDSLTYNKTGLNNAQDDGAGTITADSRQPVTYERVENVTLVEILKKIFLPLVGKDW